ncbi:putative gustatory receptor 59e [Zeugodacus cucurbitae]|uniref:putative gustatory receptor 59e n=1 Tax=Zeugodacus cucurbitae TaxID=28588 RepID=UPI0023D96951|nr:putative gustatory receptor 59e [Zeugodacus cucurbitae]
MHSLKMERLIRVLKVICQLCCVAPIAKSRLRKLNRLRYLHYVYAFLIVTHIYLFSSKYVVNVDPSHLTFEIMFYLCEIVVNNLICTLCVFNTFYYATLYREIPQKFLKIMKELQELETPQQPNEWNLLSRLYKELCCYVVGISLLTVISVGFNYVQVDYNGNEFLRFIGSYQLPNFLLLLKLGQYWLALRFTHLLYKRINETVCQRINHFDLHRSPGRNDDMMNAMLPRSYGAHGRARSWYNREFAGIHLENCEVLERLRRLYSALDTLLVRVVDMFDLILLLNFLGSVFVFSINFFELYKSYNEPRLSRMLWHLQYTARVFIILLANNAVVNEKSRTTFVLNQLYITSKELEHAVNRFLLHLMMRKPVEKVCGIVELDLMLFTGIFSVVSQYVTFLIQIDLSKDPSKISKMTDNDN